MLAVAHELAKDCLNFLALCFNLGHLQHGDNFSARIHPLLQCIGPLAGAWAIFCEKKEANISQSSSCPWKSVWKNPDMPFSIAGIALANATMVVSESLVSLAYAAERNANNETW